MGNWSVEVGGNALSRPRGCHLQMQARLDHREKIWLSGTVEGQCLQTTAGYMNGKNIRTIYLQAWQKYLSYDYEEFTLFMCRFRPS